MKCLRLQRGPRQRSGVAHTASTVGYLHRHTSPTAPTAVHDVEARSTKEQPARAAGPISIANWRPRGHFCTQIASPAPFYPSTGCQSRNCVKVFTWLKRTRRERSAPFFSPQNSQGRLRKSSSEICAKLIVRRADWACTRVNPSTCPIPGFWWSRYSKLLADTDPSQWHSQAA